MKIFIKYFLALIIILSFTVNKAMACACGCGVMNVATSSLVPNCEGGTAFLQYDQMFQTRNWSKEKHSDPSNNDDKRIDTTTVTAGAQYMFSREWGAAIRVPYVTRQTEGLSDTGDFVHTRHSDVGDVRINGIYSGFFDDMSTGLTFGVKLPTGQTNAKEIGRDQQIGTGSTDLILGAYHVGKFGSESKLGYFIQGSWDRPVARHQGYNPGYEVSAATGLYYNIESTGFVKKVTPMLQLIGTKKGESSDLAEPDNNINTGYSMAYFAPGVEISVKQFKLYADIEVPVYRNVNGNQLVPQTLYKAIISYNF